jgi:hypothetical protein
MPLAMTLHVFIANHRVRRGVVKKIVQRLFMPALWNWGSWCVIPFR